MAFCATCKVKTNRMTFAKPLKMFWLFLGARALKIWGFVSGSEGAGALGWGSV